MTGYQTSRYQFHDFKIFLQVLNNALGKNNKKKNGMRICSDSVSLTQASVLAHGPR